MIDKVIMDACIMLRNIFQKQHETLLIDTWVITVFYICSLVKHPQGFLQVPISNPFSKYAELLQGTTNHLIAFTGDGWWVFLKLGSAIEP